jgi:hypothetical protein
MAISWNAEVGINNVPSFQVSGRPYATGSVNSTVTSKITFPYVTRWVIIVNNDASNVCKVGFSAAGLRATATKSNYFVVGKADAAGQPRQSQRLELKVSELHLATSTNFDIIAGLTTIPANRTQMGTSSIAPTTGDTLYSWSGSAGVG